MWLDETSLASIAIVYLQEMRSQLENCLSDGSPLLVTDCDVTELVKDKRFSNAIRNCSSFITGKHRFKIIVSLCVTIFSINITSDHSSLFTVTTSENFDL